MKTFESSIVNVKFGKNVKIIKPVNMYNCKIEDNVFIGPFVEIQNNVRIGKNSKIQSHSFVCELVDIGENCFIGHGVMFINDKFDHNNGPSNDRKLWKKTILGDDISIGSNATILPVEICEGCVIGAGSVVTKNIFTKGIYAGNPAKIIKHL